MFKSYKVREGSVADYARVFLAGAVFWGILLGTAVSAYGM